MTDPEAGGGFRLEDVLASPRQRRLRELPQLIRQAVSLVLAAARKEFLVTAGLQALSSAGLAAQLLVGRDLLAKILDGRRYGFSPAIPDVIVLSVVIGVVAVANAARVEIQRVLAELVSRHAVRGVIDVSTAVDLLAFETPAFHDRQQRALVNASVRPLQMTTGLMALVGSSLGAIGVGVALLTIQPLFVLAVVFALVPLWLATVAASRAIYRYAVEQTELDRRRFYLQMLMTSKDTAKEIRAYDTEDFLKGRYDDLYDRHIEALRAVVRRRTRQGVIGAGATAVLTGGAVGLLIWFVSSGRLSLAGAGAAAGGIIFLGNQLQGVAAGVGSLYESSLFIRDFSSFADSLPVVLSARGSSDVPRDFENLSVTNVTFTYPSRPEASVTDVSLDLPRGKVVALVGENGSGKTTLAKLIAGLYTPDAGQVAWDGRDVATFDPTQLRSRIAVLFQDFVRYHLTARENVAMGNRYRFEEADAVAEAAGVAGADGFLSALSDGYDTLLGPEFYGGVDLSGGQWQRVALARAFFRDASLVILDEPTSSLDPRAEAELFAQVRKVFAGRTVLLISHRFATVRLADHIYVLKEGRVAETGSHAQLMARDGLYAQLFSLQAAAFGLKAGDAASNDAAPSEAAPAERGEGIAAREKG